MPDLYDDILTAASGKAPRVGKLSPTQISATLRQAGWDERHIPTMTAIAQAESSGNPSAHNAKYPDDSYGLLQVNRLAHPEFSPDELRDPLKNAQAALKVFRDKGQGFGAWSTYTKGTYKKFLSQQPQDPYEDILKAAGAQDSGQTPPPTASKSEAQPRRSPATAPSVPIGKVSSRVIEPDSGEELQIVKPRSIDFQAGQFPDEGQRFSGIEELKRQQLLKAPPQSQILSREYTANLGKEGGSQRSLAKAALRAIGLDEGLADVYARATGRPLVTISNAKPDRDGNFRFTMPKQTVDFLNAFSQGLSEGGVDEGLQRAGQVNLAARSEVRQANQKAVQDSAAGLKEAEEATRKGVESPFIRGMTGSAARAAQAIGTILPESLGDFERKALVMRAAAEEAEQRAPLKTTGQQIKAGLGAAVPTAVMFAATGPLKHAQLPVLGAAEGFTPQERLQGALQGAATAGTFALPPTLAPNITGLPQKILTGTTMAAVPATEAAMRGESIPRAIAESLPYAALPFLYGKSKPEALQGLRIEPARVGPGERMAQRAQAKEGVNITASGPQKMGEKYYNKTAHLIQAKDAQGNEIGRLVVTPNGNPLEVFVAPQQRRQGVATALYREAERLLGKPIQPGAQTPEGAAFRTGFSQKGEPQTTVQLPAEEPSPQRFYHRDFGEVAESANQQGVGKGKIRVTDVEGSEHVVQRPSGTGAGNQRAVPVREAEPTVPERPETIDLQLQALKEGRRDAVLIPRGTKPPEKVPEGTTEFITPVGTFYFDPAKTSKADIYRKVNDGSYGELLGHVAEKPAVGEPTAVVTAREGGTEVQSSAVPPEKAAEQVAATKAQNPAADIEVGGPELAQQVIRDRFAAQKSQVDINRESRGAEPLDRTRLSKSDKQLVDEATKANQQDPTQPLRLADEVLNNPRALSDKETVQLDLESVRLSNQLNNLAKSLDRETDPAAVRERAAQMDAIERDLSKLDQAYGRSGTEKGRGLRAQRIAFYEDYSPAGLIRRAIRAKKRTLTDEERTRYEQQSQRIAELESQLSAAQEKATDKEFQRQVNRYRRKQQRTETKQSLEAEFADLRSQFSQEFAKIGKGARGSGFADIDPEGRLAKIVVQIARNRIRAGITDATQLLDNVYESIREHLPASITKRDVRDAISGYGLTTHPKNDPVETRLREVKQLLRDVSAIEDIQSGEPPLRSGYQRDKPTQEIRESHRRVQEELRRHPEIERAMRDPVEQQKTLLESAKTRVRNRIEDLTKLIASNERETKTTAKVVPDAELNRLRAERDRLQELYDQIPDPNADQRTIDRALASVEKSVAELERRIETGDLEPTRPTQSPWSEQLGKAKTRQAELRKELTKLRTTAKRGTPEQQQQRQLERELAKTNKDIADLQQRIASGDVETALREGAQSPWSEELGQAKRERVELQKQLSEMRAETPEAQRREAQRKLDAANRSIAELQRKISEGDISAKPRTAPETPELAAARQEQKALRSILNNLRQVAKPKPTAAEKAARQRLATEKALQTRLEKQAAELQRKLDTSDFSQPPKRERAPYSAETARLQREVEDLKQRFNREMYRATRSTGGKISDTLARAAGVPKTIKSIGDISAVFRQGGYFAITHPVAGLAVPFRDMVRSFRDAGYRNVEESIKSHPKFEQAKRDGVEFTGVDKSDPHLSHREEGYLGSDAIDTISRGRFNPLRFTAKPVKDFSERTFISFLDSQRMSMYDTLTESLTNPSVVSRLLGAKTGLSEADLAADRARIAKAINSATGRGNLSAKGNQVAPLLNVFMFSPRLLKSRIELLNNMFNPVAIAKMPRNARAEIVKDNAKFIAATFGVLTLAKALGATVSTNPDDADFLKIRVRNTTYDTLTGLQQPLRAIINLVGTATGGDTYAGRTAEEILNPFKQGSFTRSKLSPVAGTAVDAITGKTFEGRKFTAGRAATDFVTPLPLNDFIDAMKQEGVLLGGAMATPALTGIGVQSYPRAPEKPTTHAEKLARKMVRSKLPDDAREDEQIEEDRKLAELRAKIRQGDKQAAPEVVKMIASGAITPKRGQRVLKAAGKTRLEEDLMTSEVSANDALTVYSVMSADEKRKTKALILGKIGRFQGPLDEQQKLIQRAKQMGVFAK